VVYYKQKLHKVGYFKELMMTNPDIREGLRPLLTICRETIVRLGKTEGALVRSLAREPLLSDRVERLMTIPAVGPITALTWVLEVDDVARFGSVKQAVSYCGLCAAERSSAEVVKRTPISKQRNKHLQSVLVEAAKLGPRLSPDLALVYETEKQKGHGDLFATQRNCAADQRKSAWTTAEVNSLPGEMFHCTASLLRGSRVPWIANVVLMTLIPF